MFPVIPNHQANNALRCFCPCKEIFLADIQRFSYFFGSALFGRSKPRLILSNAICCVSIQVQSFSQFPLRQPSVYTHQLDFFSQLHNYLFPLKVKKGISNRRCLISDWVCPLYFYVSCIVFLYPPMNRISISLRDLTLIFSMIRAVSVSSYSWICISLADSSISG